LVLVRKAGHVVGKDELMGAVWPDVFVEEGNLTQYVFLLRKALGPGPNGDSYIETIPRRGYRFAATVSDRPGDGPSGTRERGKRAPWMWAAALLLALFGGWWIARLREPAAPRPSAWVQLTEFPDSVSSPALSPDGRLLAFLRGPGTFTTDGQVWLKMLPDGQPVQLTDDAHLKMGPVFSPDGSRIAYTVPWDTWEVPVLGGEPRLWLPNASGLTWIEDRRVLFSEVRTGLHMGLTAATEDRARPQEIYVPADKRMMAHRSAMSPDGRWVLVAENGDGARVMASLPPRVSRRQLARPARRSAGLALHGRYLVA
jgi:hypothetical protein